MTDIGMVDYGLYLPAAFETARDIAAKTGLTEDDVRALGLRRKCRPGAEDQPVTMAAKAALAAFNRSEEITPEDIDVVIFTGEEYKDYIAQTAAIRLQEEIGCRKAYAFDLVGQGITLIVGLRIARDMMLSDPEIRTVLLTGGTRNVDLLDYRRKDTHFLLPLSASGGAMILGRDYHRNRLLNQSFHVDPEMADEILVPGGGSEHPFREDNLNSDIMFFQTARPEIMAEYLRTTWPKRLIEVVRRVSAEPGLDYLALCHNPPTTRRTILSELGLSEKYSADLSDWGRHGPNDVLLSLDMGLQNGSIQPGSNVVMASGGFGFTYAAMAFHWG
jgi:3-oxoacyl-[acyl-carrier-protein] synthase III